MAKKKDRERPPHPKSPGAHPEGLTRGVEPTMIDGQLGDTTEQGPERVNPEGSVDISNTDYQSRPRKGPSKAPPPK